MKAVSGPFKTSGGYTFVEKNLQYSVPFHPRNLGTGAGTREVPLGLPSSEKLTLPVCLDAFEGLSQCLFQAFI